MYDPYRNQDPQLFEDTSSQGYAYPGQTYAQSTQYQQGSHGYATQSTSTFTGFPGSQFMQDPVVSNIAMQYGQNLVGQGREYVDSKLESVVSVSRLKYYFAVDTKYVLKKIQLLFFPFLHTDWTIKYSSEDEGPVQPRYDINAPDLYIPLMAFVTYILVAGLCLGLQHRFSPDSLGIEASSAIVWLIIELGVVLLSFYVTAIHSKLQTLHLLALSSYKYVGMVVAMAGGLALGQFAYFCILLYSALSLVVFLFRTLRCQLHGSDSMQAYSVGTKRRFYLMALISIIQPLMMWWLTSKLVAV